MSHFPFEWQEQGLTFEDLVLFHNSFQETILHYIPFAAGPVSFVSSAVANTPYSPQADQPKYWNRYLKRLVKQQSSVVVSDKKILFLPIWNDSVLIGAAVVKGIDEKFAKSLSREWLSDRSRILSREFFLQKQLTIDPATGLLNGRHLYDVLDGLCSEVNKFEPGHKKKITNLKDFVDGPQHYCSLFLIEIYPRAQNAEKALNYVSRAGHFLNSCLGQSVMYHLDNGVFALIVRYISEDQSQKLGQNILNWLRRESYNRVHIGIASLVAGNVHEKTAIESVSSADLLNQAWLALRKAARRGPYAFCTFNSIRNPATHPLRRPSAAAMIRLRKLWNEEESFAVLLLKQDGGQNSESFFKRALILIEAEARAIRISDREAYVFLPGLDAPKGLRWARKFKKKLDPASDITFSIGVAGYPCIDFKKSDTPHNARKALLHTAFYGPDTMTAFDAVSLNISGDIYYGEGDLVRAVREYRKGLELDPADTNLLNSLGESFAQMNKPKLAKPYFEKVLQADSRHYMALFNMGVTSLLIGEEDLSIKCFEKALAVAKRKPEINNKNDLLMQLGKLYCRTGKFSKAVTLFEASNLAEEGSSKGLAVGTVLRYLGEAYKGIGKNKEAVTVLQRAIRYNPHDAFSLSMLGELYAVENQGDDIALSLCEQAVELDDVPWMYRYRLAWIRYRLKDYDLALQDVRECLRRNNKSLQTLMLAGNIYAKMGKKRLATAKYEKVLTLESAHREATAELSKIRV